MMTLKKISNITGFSVSTISKALNDRHDIKADTKKMIQDLAFKTNYIPNKNAIALRSNKSSIVAVVVPRINHELYGEILYEIHKCAVKKGFRIMLFQSFDDVSQINQCLEDINDGSVDAAIVLTSHATIEQQLSNTKRKYFPIDFFQIKPKDNQLFVNHFCNKLFEKLILHTNQ